MDIEKHLSPTSRKLITKDGEASAVILDEELDSLDCDFNNDLCVTINTEDYTHITLSLRNLKDLKRLIIESEKYYNEYFKIHE